MLLQIRKFKHKIKCDIVGMVNKKSTSNCASYLSIDPIDLLALSRAFYVDFLEKIRKSTV